MLRSELRVGQPIEVRKSSDDDWESARITGVTLSSGLISLTDDAGARESLNLHSTGDGMHTIDGDDTTVPWRHLSTPAAGMPPKYL
jgi:hypothetical protein